MLINHNMIPNKTIMRRRRKQASKRKSQIKGANKLTGTIKEVKIISQTVTDGTKDLRLSLRALNKECTHKKTLILRSSN